MTAAHLESASGPVFYRRAEVDLSEFLPLRKEGTTRVAELVRPLLIQTPTLTLASPLHDDDESGPPHVHLALPPAFAQFATEVEGAALQAALDNKAEWFGDIDDDTLVAAFRPLCKPSGHLRVELPDDAVVFDADGALVSRAQVTPGHAVRAILRLDRITFGRTEFEAAWTLVQAQARPPSPPQPGPPRCLISSEDDDSSPGNF